MLHTAYVIVDNCADTSKYYWGPNGWTLDLFEAYYFESEPAAETRKADEELTAIVETIEID